MKAAIKHHSSLADFVEKPVVLVYGRHDSQGRPDTGTLTILTRYDDHGIFLRNCNRETQEVESHQFVPFGAFQSLLLLVD